MKAGAHLARVLAAACLVLSAAHAEAGSLVIPAWSFARGNARIDADPDQHADAGPIIGPGPRLPWGWRVEYDVDIPVTAKYMVQVCYASAEARPLDVSFDDQDADKCCTGVTFGPKGKPTSNSSGATWEPLYKRGTLQPLLVELTEGIHTIKLASDRPLPNVVAIRLDTPTEFPVDWQSPRFTVRDLDAIPARHRGAFAPTGAVQTAAQPVREFPKDPRDRSAKPRIIPAWTFDRGNVAIYASPDRYADGGPMVGGGSPDEGVVEYDIEFPADGEYTLQVRYAAAEARPADVWLDGKHLGKTCVGLTIGSSRFELPVKFSWTSKTAKWEQLRERGQLVKLSVAKGLHTLKLSRRGPLPNLAAIALQPGWNGPARAVRHIDRVPSAQRAAFLPPGAVNTAALRQAIVHTMAAFGSRYPGGPKFLERLTALEAKQAAFEDGGPEELQAIHDELTALRQDVLLAHPDLEFDKLLFLKRCTDGYGHTYSDQHHGTMGGSLCVLSPVGPDGKVTELVPELSGGLFDRFDLSYDAKKVVFGYKREGEGTSFRIYEVDIDPSTGRMVPGSLRQLTFGGGDEDPEARRRNAGRVCQVGRDFDDMDPCYLPDGRIMFVSTRAMQIVFCAPGASVTNLYIMNGDGSNLRRVSDSPVNETALSVMNDGRVLYTRWEYVDKGLGNGQSLWAIRPDGTGVDHVYKNNTMWPAAMSSARSIPGSSRIVTVGGTHHFAAVGPVILVDTRSNRRTDDAMHCITPEVGYPPSMGYPSSPYGMFMDPYPFSEEFFLVSHRPGKPHRIGRHEQAFYGLYALDAWGNKAVLHRDPKLSCFEPMPLRPRPRPLAIASIDEDGAPDEAPGTLFVQDVYEGMTGIERGRVKYLRVVEAMAWPWNAHGISWSLGMNADPHRKKIHGVVRVEEDGSCCFTVPSGKNLLFQVLDENYMALQQMPTFINMMPGEQRSCIGCHEPRRLAPSTAPAAPMAFTRPAQKPVPQPGDTGPRMVHYPTDIQSILDKRCVGCHSGPAAKARLDLTGVPTEKWNRSHENLINRRLVSYADCRYGAANFNAVPPLSRGSHLSKLTMQIRQDPCKAGMTREEFIRIVTWIDVNVPYYGTYRGKRSLRDKDDPEYRLPPLAGR